jgi:hypothetical protein
VDNAVKLPPTHQLAKWFTTPPAYEHIHIIVDPSIKIRPVTPLLPEKAMYEVVELFETRLATSLRTYLFDDVQLPLWEPQEGTQETRDFIAALKIPMLSPSSQSPSLLVHRIGRSSHDSLLESRVNRLFDAAPHRAQQK